MKPKPKHRKAFNQNGVYSCPACHSDDVSHDDEDIEVVSNDLIDVTFICNGCNSEWIINFTPCNLASVTDRNIHKPTSRRR